MPHVLVGIKREYEVLDYLSIPEIKILEGVRRSGKSTLLYQVVQRGFETGKKVLYINFDDDVLGRYSLEDIFYAFLEREAVDYLLIDEVQQCKDWVPFVRKCYDRKELEQIWITGSNSSLIKKEYAELLTGRNIKLSISPLSFAEYIRFKGVEKVNLPVSRKQEATLKRSFDSYLLLGSFPAIALRDVFQRELLNNYFEDFIYKDIATRYDVNVSKLKDLVVYLATHSTKLFSYRKIAGLLGLHANTVNDYISHMKEVFLLDEVYKFDFSLKGQYGTDKKIYWIDTGLANTISFRFSEDKGRMLETTVYRHLRRLSHEVYFHRGKKECDFVVKRDLEITQAIQVTCSMMDEKTREREVAGLLEAMKAYQLNTGLILTLDEEEQFSVEGDYTVLVKPVWKWMLERKPG